MSFDVRSDFLTLPCDGFCNRVADGTHDSPQESETGKLLVTSKNVKDGRLTRDSAYRISVADFDAINKRSKVDQWDLLLTMIGTVGEVCIVDMAEPDFAIKNVGLLKCGDELRAKWLYYYLRSPLGQEAIEQRKKGSTQQYISLTEIRQLPVTYPGRRQEMQLIVEHLAAIDDRITLLRETNATLEAIAQALFKSWFVDFDPVRAKLEGRAPEGMDEATARLFPESFEESELGLVPRGWRVGVLTEISKISSGNRPNVRSDAMTDAAPIPLFGGAGIMGFTNESLFQVRKILTGRVGTLGKVHIAYPPFWASDNVLVLSPEESHNFLYCFHWLKSIDVHSLNRGSTQPLLTQKDLGKQQHVIPTEPVLSTFAAIAEVIYEAIQHNAEQAHTLATLRDTLLPRLISGQLRLPEAQAAAAEALA